MDRSYTRWCTVRGRRPAVAHIDVFKGWAETIRQDIDAHKALLENEKASADARKLAGAALSYLVSKMDLIPDWNEGIGVAIDEQRRAGELRRAGVAHVPALAVLGVVALVAGRGQRPHDVLDALHALGALGLRLERVVGMGDAGEQQQDSERAHHLSFCVR